MDLRRGRPARSRVPRRLRPLLDPAAARYWLTVIVLAATLAGIVGRAVSSAEDARDAWGTRRTVLVAARDLGTGDAIGHASVRAVTWPTGLIPPGTVSTLPGGARARNPLSAGSPLTEHALARLGDGLASGARTLAIPVDERSLDVGLGDQVDLWSVPDTVAGGDGDATRVATGAEVIDVHDAMVVVAVRPAQVAPLAEAVATSHIVLVGSP